jgi:hypothetical protein
MENKQVDAVKDFFMTLRSGEIYSTPLRKQ